MSNNAVIKLSWLIIVRKLTDIQWIGQIIPYGRSEFHNKILMINNRQIYNPVFIDCFCH